MSRRTIKMDQIRSVEATLHNYISSGFTQAQNGAIVQDESADLLDGAFRAMFQTTEGLSEAVEGLNGFLNKVADAFENIIKICPINQISQSILIA